MKVTRTSSFSDDWDENSSDELKAEYKGDSSSYEIYEGETEDMIFGRALESLEGVIEMIKMAHQAGKDGVELEIIEIEE